MRKVPDIGTATTKGYAALLAHNFDTIQECFNLRINSHLEARLEEGKKDANQTHEGQGSLFIFGGKEFQIWSRGSTGNLWVLENDDIQIHISSPKRNWAVSVRYISAGLWEHGALKMRAFALKVLLEECLPLEQKKVLDENGQVMYDEKEQPITETILSNIERIDKWRVLTRADYAFDFLSPLFSREMGLKNIEKNVVAASGIKIGTVGTSKRLETLTIGMSKSGLSIQVYDKGREMREKAHKKWMYKVYEQEGYYPEEGAKGRDIWRVEIRMKKDYLKPRNLRSFEKLLENMEDTLCGAIFDRRLCVPDKPKREDWSLHPLWAEVYQASGSSGQYVPIGRQLSFDRREELLEVLQRQMAGLMRASAVLQYGNYSDEYSKLLFKDSMDMIHMDTKHENKVFECVERYRFFDEAH